MNEGGITQPDASGSARRIRVTVILTVLAIIATLTTILSTQYKFNYYYQSDIDVAGSTVAREPLPEGCVKETGYYTDELNILIYESELLPGLNKFYNMTGVQPYVYLTSTNEFHSISGPTQTEMKEFAESKYQELFTDDAHLLLVFFKDNQYYSSYKYWYAVGQRASSVFDTEAGSILGNYLDKYYYDQGLTYEQYFSEVFGMTAERIMSVTVYPLSPLLVILGVLAAAAIAASVLLVIRHMRRKREEEARRTESLLNIPLKKFSDKEDKAEKLSRNYDDDPNNDVKL